ncbi:MAG: aspartate carbamoyltransferase catalytic subunit [Alphaproteobacteria bacterium]|nr:aspartate carbamoyltransferase catalytic subunit [Alphaproteobacteria bacterium]MCZ6511755.1 aspartate carbamoyltransferase catalytic subunit [Alphaproteobacteria bacterium]MCZ6587502.1 aspartate carbamoyltransferase catalytic subunit [Alphaproteobacteria bacterium]MCZ6590024.1 aspartate carbamoyltransferase catalytic subunit [Alphaproteobacteria bacterium]MCZ6844547.1 aspartate carbamoyltransferase catalytic subunit [Alphaproteobacteria bacterium]
MSTPLRIVREKLNITQTELASLMGTTQATVSRMEAGQWEPNASQVQAVLAKSSRLGVELSVDDFVLPQALQSPNNGAPAVVVDRHFDHRHLLGIQDLSPDEISFLLDLSDTYAERNRTAERKQSLLAGKTVINLFFEESTRTRTSFELAGKRLGADVINIAVASSSIKKGETVIDTAMTLNAMHADALVVRHTHAGAVQLLSEKVNCSVINAGDGSHEHPTQALLDALTIRRRKGHLQGLLVALCGDVAHSRVARSNIYLLQTMGARVRVIAPPTLVPAAIERLGVEVFHDMRAGLADCDIVMMLRLQRERMQGSFVPSVHEYFHFYGLDYDKLSHAKPDALIMHPGPMNRGVEIDSAVADDIDRSVIHEQVEMGVAVRMACLDILTRDDRRNTP